jgi:HEAT repeat protein
VGLGLLFGVLLLLSTQQAVGPEVVRQWIGHLGSFDAATRIEAGRQVRRTSGPLIARELAAAARRHQDEFVRFRAFVLLSGLDQAVMDEVASDLLADRNDRVRTVAYQWFEHHPRPAVLDRLLAALRAEDSEFVRPALTRAIAAAGSDPRAQAALRPLVLQGQDLFRGSVIAALGDYNGRYATDELLAVAAVDGPLQDDAVTALGRLKEPQVGKVLRSLQAAGPRDLQPTVSAALCLIGIDCAARFDFLVSTLRFAASNDGHQPLLRGAAHALAMLVAGGNREALGVLLDTARGAPEPVRAPIALALGTVVLRDPSVVLATIDQYPTDVLSGILRDAFDMLSEDFEEERFGGALRRVLWDAPEGSDRRRMAADLARILEF